MVQTGEDPVVHICIPAYYAGPETPRVLGELLQTIKMQDYSSDKLHTSISLQHCSLDERAQMLSATKQHPCNIIYPPESVKGPAANTNSVLGFAQSCAFDSYIKIMNQDDLLDSPDAIRHMVDLLHVSEAKWLASACIHTDDGGIKRERPHMPRWPGEKNMVEGVNRIGCPSVIMFDSALKLECDENVLYAMDCDMYIQLYRQAGLPVCYAKPDVVVRMWESQLTNNLDIPRQLEQDKATMRNKYGYA